ncbi:Pc20g04920 [Penicillium rubens Wisconsin 54-1255]|uniref:Pc20g04920 protein n=1 Tax=Penicillium rubens (strain ATCC 28089 / DSM 1075 / NRRL 1951 / Wisconsin 54-1255) TaxID=500485 RepID=B6HEB7_PENRW|nr:Pc20g04920 [Penicillium rubens Wisconsin 54-1255]
MPRPNCPWRQIAPKGDGSPDDLGNVPVTLDELEIDACSSHEGHGSRMGLCYHAAEIYISFCRITLVADFVD